MKRLEAALGLLLAVTLAGCVRVYHPISGFRPVVADTTAANFTELNLTVKCVPGKHLSRSEANNLCRRVSRLFENQGAVVRVVDGGGSFDDGDGGGPLAPSDLTLELRTRDVHKQVNAFSWALCLFTFTVLPGIDEQTFVQDIEIRDQSGFLLVRDSLEGRLVRRFGAGPWVGNALLDVTVRKEGEKLTGDQASLDLSEDMYEQLTQLMVNAKVQRQILLESADMGRR